MPLSASGQMCTSPASAQSAATPRPQPACARMQDPEAFTYWRRQWLLPRLPFMLVIETGAQDVLVLLALTWIMLCLEADMNMQMPNYSVPPVCDIPFPTYGKPKRSWGH